VNAHVLYYSYRFLGQDSVVCAAWWAACATQAFSYRFQVRFFNYLLVLSVAVAKGDSNCH
jgi:hypothetical protein